jgi:hypothetical protein
MSEFEFDFEFDSEYEFTLRQFLDVLRGANSVQRTAILEAALSETDGMTFLYDLACEADTDFPMLIQVLTAIRLNDNGIPDSFPADQVVRSESVHGFDVGLMRAVVTGVVRDADNSATHRIVDLYTVDPFAFDAEDEYPGALALIADGLRMPVVRSAGASARAPTGMSACDSARASTRAPTDASARASARAPTPVRAPVRAPVDSPTRASVGSSAGASADASASTSTRAPVRTSALKPEPCVRMTSHTSAVGTRR